jgi:hypothetical protein
LNVSINSELIDELAAYALYTHQGITPIVERAIWEHLDANRPSLASLGNVGVPFPRDVSDEKNDIDDDDDGIIRLYQELTANPFRDGDRRFLEEVRQYGHRTIATALFIGRSRYTKRINSLRFFYNNILEVAAWQPDKINQELRYHADMHRRKTHSAK